MAVKSCSLPYGRTTDYRSSNSLRTCNVANALTLRKKSESKAYALETRNDGVFVCREALHRNAHDTCAVFLFLSSSPSSFASSLVLLTARSGAGGSRHSTVEDPANFPAPVFVFLAVVVSLVFGRVYLAGKGTDAPVSAPCRPLQDVWIHSSVGMTPSSVPCLLRRALCRGGPDGWVPKSWGLRPYSLQSR